VLELATIPYHQILHVAFLEALRSGWCEACGNDQQRALFSTCKTRGLTVGVVPTHTRLSLQCLGNKLVAFFRGSPSFLKISWRVRGTRRLIFRYIPLRGVVLRRVIELTLHRRSEPTRQGLTKRNLPPSPITPPLCLTKCISLPAIELRSEAPSS
jgi:hypothetical protein